MPGNKQLNSSAFAPTERFDWMNFYRLGLIGKSSRLPSLPLLLSKVSSLENVWTWTFCPSSPLAEISSPNSLNLLPSQLHAIREQSPTLYVLKIPLLSLWFLQARCGLLFTIINNHHAGNSWLLFLQRVIIAANHSDTNIFWLISIADCNNVIIVLYLQCAVGDKG